MRKVGLVCRVCFLAALALALLAGVSSTLPAAAQDRGWSTPLDLGRGWFPDITADAGGRVHLAWASSEEDVEANQNRDIYDDLSGYDLVLYTYTDDGEAFAPTNDIIAIPWTAGSEVTRPSLWAGRDGVLHLAYRGVQVYYDRTRVENASDASFWRQPYPMNFDQVGYFSRMAMDGDGGLHLIYTENVRTPTCDNCFHVFYRNSTDNGLTWSLRSDVSLLPTGSAKPQIIIGSQENIYVVWEAGRGGATGQLFDPTTAMISFSRDRGTTWSAAHEFVVPDGEAKNITIAQDGHGRLVVVYLALPEDRVYYTVSYNQGRTWNDPKAIEGIWGGWTNYQARLDDYSMAVDSLGNVHLVLVGRVLEDQDELNLLHLTWDGVDWSEPDVITTIEGNVPEWPRIAISDGNFLHVAWFIRAEEAVFDSEQGLHNVFYSNRRISAPEIERAPFPTMTPQVFPTATAELPLPTSTPVDPSIAATDMAEAGSFSVYSERDELVQIGTAILPALLLIGIVIGVVLVVRKR